MCSIGDEINCLDLVLHRYGGNVEFFMSLPFGDGLQLIKRAMDQEQDGRIFLQWAVQLPFMSPEKPVSYQEYKDRVTGKNLDLRPTQEIVKELMEVNEKLTGGAYHGT